MHMITMDRYSRQIALPEIGPDGQGKLSRAAVLVVGLGGLGAPVSQYLTGAGIGRLGLCDKDTVSLSNIHRQILYSEQDVGRPKTEAAYARLHALSSATRFDLWPEGLTSANARDIISGYDIVVDCTDNHATRFLIADTCAATSTPWVYGSIGAFEGRVATFLPGSPSYADLFPDREALSDAGASTLGVLGTLPCMVGAIEATEVIKHICGFGETLAGRLMTINLKNLTFNIFEL